MPNQIPETNSTMTLNSLKLYPSNEHYDTTSDPEEMAYHIAIIGGGPKGLYGLERLLAFFKAEPPALPVAIHIFNRSPFIGAGDVYRPDQPEYLMMNYSNDYINMWPGDGPSPVVPQPQSFTEWLEKNQEEAAVPDACAKRALVGAYLMDGFEQLRQNCPENVQIHTHEGEVTDVIPEGEVYRLELENASGRSVLDQPFAQLFLTTGHPKPHSGFTELESEPTARQHLANHLIQAVYPVEKQLAEIRPQENVLVKGLGLTFIDAVLALTEGRGGQFTETSEVGLIYHPSGREPHKIYPYSRSGLPMFPRQSSLREPQADLFYFKREKLEEQFKDQPKIDFKTELLPLIDREIIIRYYRVLFRKHGETLELSDDFDRVRAQIDTFHRTHPAEKPFSLDNLLTALPQPALGLHQSFVNQLDNTLEAARQGKEHSPLAAAVATWRDISPVFNDFYSFGRLSPDGQREFLEKYAGHFNRLAYGPPIVNLEKIRAIAAAGILDFSFARSPEIEFRPELDCFMISHPFHPLHTTAYYWLDARIPKVQLSRDVSKLYRNMQERGMIRKYHNTDGQTTFCPGCMDLDHAGHPRDIRGRSQERITAYGTPTEGVTYDNDTLSRQRNDFASEWAKGICKRINAEASANQR
ncbi:FAD/NAD(P)-binding protein [Flavilitoribacter nigricans]|uniref:FAD/NAD(P)-binding protein n=1 Tax=Flavilitoribacter nigricans TaxID=70997 RepID=UPI0014762023|nr:FAD/NAD(P)-binding protein [Flavilitoribacter nigricans]